MSDRDVVIRINVETAAGRRALKALGVDVDGTSRKVHGVGPAADGAQRKVVELGSAGTAALSRMGGAGDAVAQMLTGGIALGAGVAATAIAGTGVRTRMEFDQTAAELQAITGIMGRDLAVLSETALDASILTGQSARDQVEAYKLIASNMDVPREQLQAMGADVVTLAVAAGTDLPLAANVATNTLNQFGLAADQTGRVVNVLAAGAKKGAAEVPDLADSLREAGTTAAGANVPLEATVGAIEVLAQNALKGSQAGTGLRNVITILDTETRKLADNGIAGVNLQGDGLTRTLQRLEPLLDNSAGLVNVFGRENLNAARILIQNAAAVDTMTTAVTGTNVAHEQAEIQADTLTGDLDKLRAAWKALLIDGSGPLNENLRELVQTGVSVLSFLRDNWDALEAGVKVILIATAAHKSYQIAQALATSGAVQMQMALGAKSTAAAINAAAVTGARRAMLSFSAAVRANPIGLIVGVLATATAAYVTLRQNTADATSEFRQQRAEVEALTDSIEMLSATAAASRAETARSMRAELSQQMAALNAEREQLQERRDALNTDVELGRVGPALMDKLQASRIDARLEQIRAARVEIGDQMRLADLAVRDATLQMERAQQAIDAAQASVGSTRTAPSPAAAPSSTAPSSTAPSSTRDTRPDDEARIQGEIRDLRAATITATRVDEEELARHRFAMAKERAAQFRQDADERARLIVDETEREVQLALNAFNETGVLYNLETARIEEVKQFAVQAANERYEAEAERIAREMKGRDKAALRQAALDAARTERDHAIDVATHAAIEDQTRAEREQAAARDEYAARRRQLLDDHAAAEHASMRESQEAAREAARQAVDDYERAEEEKRQADEETHRQRMDNLYEYADGVSEVLGRAVSLYNALMARQRETLRQQTEAEAEAMRESQETEQERFDEQAERDAAAHEQQIANIQAQMQADGVSAGQRQALENQLRRAQQQSADARRRNELAAERLREQHADAEAARVAEAERQDLALRRRQAKAERAQALFEIAVQTALAVVEALPNIPLSIVVGAAGALQAGTVLATPLPAYAVGTDSAAGGLALVGERGPEIVDIPRGASVLTNARSEQLAAAVNSLNRAGGAAPRAIVQSDPALRDEVSRLRSELARQTAALGGRLDVLADVVSDERARPALIAPQQASEALADFDDRQTRLGHA